MGVVISYCIKEVSKYKGELLSLCGFLISLSRKDLGILNKAFDPAGNILTFCGGYICGYGLTYWKIYLPLLKDFEQYKLSH